MSFTFLHSLIFFHLLTFQYVCYGIMTDFFAYIVIFFVHIDPFHMIRLWYDNQVRRGWLSNVYLILAQMETSDKNTIVLLHHATICRVSIFLVGVIRFLKFGVHILFQFCLNPFIICGRLALVK